MVNDLAINYQDRWKYVDDTSLSETIGKDCQSNLQSIINEIDRWCSENDMMLNRSKCKDLIISFTNNKPNFDPLVIAEGCIPQVSSAKILGLNFSSDLVGRCTLNILHRKPRRDYSFCEYLNVME